MVGIFQSFIRICAFLRLCLSGVQLIGYLTADGLQLKLKLKPSLTRDVEDMTMKEFPPEYDDKKNRWTLLMTYRTEKRR